MHIYLLTCAFMFLVSFKMAIFGLCCLTFICKRNGRKVYYNQFKANSTMITGMLYLAGTALSTSAFFLLKYLGYIIAEGVMFVVVMFAAVQVFSLCSVLGSYLALYLTCPFFRSWYPEVWVDE